MPQGGDELTGWQKPLTSHFNPSFPVKDTGWDARPSGGSEYGKQGRKKLGWKEPKKKVWFFEFWVWKSNHSDLNLQRWGPAMWTCGTLKCSSGNDLWALRNYKEKSSWRGYLFTWKQWPISTHLEVQHASSLRPAHCAPIPAASQSPQHWSRGEI